MLPDAASAGLGIASALGDYWMWRGQCAQILEPVQALCEQPVTDGERAAGLTVLARVEYWLGDPGASRATADRALALARRVIATQEAGRVVNWPQSR